MIETIQKLRFFIGGYFSSNSEIIITNEVAIYRSSESSFYFNKEPIEKIIADLEKEELIKTLNTLEVIDWKDKYESDVLDGIKWEFEISYNNGSKKRIYGSNCYPGKTELISEYTPEFSILLKTFDNLLNISQFNSNG